MADLIKTLHPATSTSDNLYPNILTGCIPDSGVTLVKLDSTITLNDLYGLTNTKLSLAYVDISTLTLDDLATNGKLSLSNVDTSSGSANYTYNVRLTINKAGFSDPVIIELAYTTSYEFTSDTSDAGWFADLIETMEYSFTSHTCTYESGQTYFVTMITDLDSGNGTLSFVAGGTLYTVDESEIGSVTITRFESLV